MRVLFLLAAVAIVGLVFTGAIRLQRTNSTITIQIDKEQVVEDAKEFIEDGREVIREALDGDDSERR